ncbi:MAG: hypothetical protein QM775_05725 [Pirellulales bacterium]
MISVHACRFALLRFVIVVAGFWAAGSAIAAEPIDIGERRELFVDDFLIERLSGDTKQELQIPEPKEVVFKADAAWEGNTSGYFCVFADGDGFRMYYRGSGYGPKTEKARHPEYACLALSKDGRTWTRPELNVFEFEGSKANNIVWSGNSATHNFAVFKDENPAATPEARYKAIGANGKPRAYQSADGVHWTMIADRALVSKGTFDSQNTAFWDAARNQYRMYWRINPNSVRGIRTAASADFAKFTDEADLVYPGKPTQDDLPYLDRVQLYTNAVQTYARAPHLFIGFPTQYVQKTKDKPARFNQTQPLFMSSRDGAAFQRWDQPVIPTSAPQDRDGNRGNYMAWGLLQLPGDERELSVYATEGNRQYGDTRVRRFTYRTDGFVGVVAGKPGGELLTKPLAAAGHQLTVNYRASAGGSLRVELQDAEGRPLQGFRAEDCEPLTGDEIDAPVRWKANATPNGAAPFRIRYVLENATLYAMKFSSKAASRSPRRAKN